MDAKDFMPLILHAIPYPIVFVDTDHVIRYLNRRAELHYYQERGYRNLIGKSIFECHSDRSRRQIEETVQRFEKHGKEEFLHVNTRNERVYLTPVRDEEGMLIGYFERSEGNFARD